jgi:hypothetical protein
VYLDEVLGLNTGWPIPSKCLFQLATPAGFEPATFSLEGNGPTSYFNAVLIKDRLPPPLKVNG